MLKARGVFIVLICLVFLSISLSGCGTLKGATVGTIDGVKEDWETAKRWDAKFREDWW